MFTFFSLTDTGVLDSFEERYITRVAAVNSFARVLNSRESENLNESTDM